MNREVFTQLEKAFARYFVATDSADRHLVHGIIGDLVEKAEIIETDPIAQELAERLLLDPAFEALQSEDFSFLKNKIAGILYYYCKHNSAQSVA